MNEPAEVVVTRSSCPWLIISLGIVLLFIFTLVTSWWTAPQWLPPLVDRLAGQAGVELEELDVGRPGWGGWTVPQVVLRTPDHEFHINDLVLGWQCCESLAESLTASIGSLSVMSLQVSDDSDTVSPIAISALLQTLHQRIPVVKLSVRKLELDLLDELPLEDYLSARVERNKSGLRLALESSIKGQRIDAEIAWTAPDQLNLKTSFANTELMLTGKLDNLGQWTLQGPYFIDATTLAAFIRPELTLGKYFDTLLGKGEFTGRIPDVLLAGLEWKALVNNTLLARLVSPALSLEGRQELSLLGITTPSRFQVLPTDVSVNVPADVLLSTTLPSTALPSNWKISLMQALDCELPLDRLCLSKLPIHLNSAGLPDQVDLSFETVVDAADIKAGLGLKLRAAFAQPASKPMAMLPGRVDVVGRYHVDVINAVRVSGNVPTEISWENLALGKELVSEGAAGLSRLSFSLHAGNILEATAEIAASTTLIHQGQKTEVSLNTPVSWQQEKFHLSPGSLQAFGLTENIEAGYDRQTEKGWLSANGGGTLKDLRWIRNWIPTNPEELSIVPGDIENTTLVNLNLKNALKVQGRSQIALKRWQLTKDPYSIKGMDATADLQFSESNLRLVAPLKVDVKSAHYSVPLKNLAIQAIGKINWNGPVQCNGELQSVQLETFGGSARLLQPAQLDCALTKSYLPVEVRDLDLSQLVAVENERVQATGRIAGLLPINITNRVVSIDDGQVAAQGSGSIKLVDADHWRQMAGDNPALLFAVDALQNLQYQSLTSDVAYNQEGLLLFNVALEGTNPDFHNGVPVKLNVNISSNIMKLLKSAEFPDVLERRLEKRFQQ